MKYMLDTNICIEVIRKKNCGVIQKFENHISDGFCISAVTYSELLSSYLPVRISNPETKRSNLAINALT